MSEPHPNMARVGDTVVDRGVGYGRGKVVAGPREDGRLAVDFGANSFGDRLVLWLSPEHLEVEAANTESCGATQ